MKVTLSYSPEVKKQLEEKYHPGRPRVILRTSTGNPSRGEPPSITLYRSPLENSLFKANATLARVEELLDYMKKTARQCELGETLELPELSIEETEAVLGALRKYCEPYDVKITIS